MTVLTLVLPLLLATAGAVEVQLEPRGGATFERATLEKHVVSTTDAAGATSHVELRAEGWWSPRLPVAPDARVVTLPVWRTGRVQGRVSVDGAAPPGELRLVVESPPDPRQQPEIARGTDFRCPVNADGTWACDLPATRLDIAIRAGAYTPHYRWGTVVDAQRAVDFGTVHLRKGASVLAWLDRDSVRALQRPARAALVRMVAPGEASIAAARLATPVAEATFSAGGAVQLAPVPAGVYMLVVSAEGFATARAHPLEVDESGETILRRAVALHRPLTARVTIAPPSDPRGAPWTVSLKRRSDFSSGFEPGADTAARTNGAGTAALHGQSPGTFAVVVKDAKGNSFFEDAWTLTTAADAERQISVRLTEIKGEVTLRDEPIAATLSFGGTHGAVRIEMTSDERGEFSGYLPRAGKWRVAVRRGGERAPSLLDVDVPENGDVRIELPDTFVSGLVLDSRGELVARARVTLLVPGTAMTTRTDAAGHFAFHSVPFGRRTLSAAAPDGEEASASVDVEVTPDTREHRALELKLLPKRAFTGRVLSAGAPVAGARVRALPLDVRGGAASAISDTTGAFRMHLREDVRRVSMVVAAPGHALQAIASDVSATPLTIELVRDGGALLLDLPPAFSVLDVTLNGVWVPSHDLFGWAAALGERSAAGPRRIPNVMPGSVRVCVTPEGESAARCRSGQLARGGSLRLELAN